MHATNKFAPEPVHGLFLLNCVMHLESGFYDDLFCFCLGVPGFR